MTLGKSVSRTYEKSTRQGKGCMVAFGLLFAAFGALFICFTSILPSWRVVRSSHWAPTPCRVISATVETIHGDNSSTYKLKVQYAYQYQGREYTGDRYDFFNLSDSNRSGKERLAKQLREEPQSCWVNPAQPEQSVLRREYHLSYVALIIPLAFMAFGLFFAFLARRIKGTQITFNLSQRQSMPSATPSASGMVELHNSLAPGLIVLLLFTLIWNGVVVLMWVYGGKFGDMCFTLVRLGFSAAGLLLIYALVRGLMQAMVPRPLLKVSASPLRLGDRLEIRWNYTQSVASITQMTLTLVGREEATYRRGTTTTTDKNEFARFTIADLKMQNQIASGRTEITIPLDVVPSFAANNNRIVWVLELKQQVRNWPDTKQEYPLTLNPAEVS